MILGLTGRMGAGKDTVADRLEKLFPDVTRTAFADPLKDGVCGLFGITRANIEEWKNDPQVRVEITHEDPRVNGWAPIVADTFRGFLQKYGTEAHRDIFGLDFWTNATLPISDETQLKVESAGLYVITDVRFESETNRVREVGGKIVKVIGLLDDAPVTHSSEVVPDYYDFLVDNVVRDDGFAALDKQLQSLILAVAPLALESKP